jgi:hypothetical protein
MSSADDAVTFEYRTELDRFYQLSRWRAMSQTADGEHPEPEWIPSDGDLMEQKERTETVARNALDSRADRGEVYTAAVHRTTKGHVAEFLGQLSIDRDDQVCVRGSTDEIRRVVLSGLCEMLSIEPVTIAASSLLDPVDKTTPRPDGGVASLSADRRADDVASVSIYSDPKRLAAILTERIVGINDLKRRPIVDFTRLTQFDVSEPWITECIRSLLSVLSRAGIGALVQLPGAGVLSSGECNAESIATHTIDLRSTNAGIEAKALGAESSALSENWWLLRES